MLIFVLVTSHYILGISCLIAVLCSCTPREQRDSQYSTLVRFHDPQSMRVERELSNLSVTCFAEDTTGYIWIGTQRGLNRYNAYEYRQYFYNKADSTSLSSDHVMCLTVDSKSRLWVGLDNGLCLYTGNDNFHRIPAEHPYSVHQVWENADGRILVNMTETLYEYDWNLDSLVSVIERFDPEQGYYNQCFVDRSGDLWSVVKGAARCFDGRDFSLVRSLPFDGMPYYSYLGMSGILMIGTDKGLLTVDIERKEFYTPPYQLSSMGEVFHLGYSENTQRHYVYTDKGLFFYNRDNGETYSWDQEGFPFVVPRTEISALFIDSHHNIWVGTPNKGLITNSSYQNRFIGSPFLTGRMTGHQIISVTADGDAVWMADSENRIYVFDASSPSLTEVNTDSILDKPRPNLLSIRLLADKDHHLWLLDDGKLYRCIYKDGRLIPEKYYADVAPATCIREGKDGTIWVGTASNVIWHKNPGEDVFVSDKLDIPGIPFIYDVLPLRNGDIVLALALNNPLYWDRRGGEERPIPLSRLLRTEPKLTTCLLQDHKGDVWLGTSGEGLFRYEPSISYLEKVNGISSEKICSLVEDGNGDIWVSTFFGLNKITDADFAVTSFNATDGIGGDQFTEGAALMLGDGYLLFGGTHGITLFNPDEEAPGESIKLVFDDLLLGGNPVQPGTGLCIDRPLAALRSPVRLTYKENDFSVTFSALDFNSNHQIRYAYKLDGYNDDWVDIRQSREAHFSNVSPGRYTLRIRAIGASEGKAVENQLKVRISPAPWNSWWAWTLYAILALSLVLSLARLRMRVLRQRADAQRLAMENSFFTNISHEFRTPLTMISGPVTLLEQADLPEKEKRLVQSVSSNSKRMLKLVNQLMDFGKLDKDTLRLGVRSCNITEVIRDTLSLFREAILEKEIELVTVGLEEPFEAPVDADKMDKVLTNLLSNAVKFTPRGGRIVCAFDVEGDTLSISVSDNGISIPQESLERIFDRYYQVENHHNYGTGIGLYYSRRLVDIHHGTIHCENIMEGGVRFIVELPAKDIYTAEEHATEEQGKLFPLAEEDKNAPPVLSKTLHDKSLLLVDDDPGIIRYLRMLLGDEYDLLTAYDADSAISLMREKMPDLVLSDVAMPMKDGFTLCKEIKEDLATSHIPVILVTAKTRKEEQIAGLDTGADAYVTKPFDPDVLKALIRSHLANRERLRQALGQATDIGQVESNTISPQDKTFMDSLFHLMENHLSDSEMDITVLTEELFMSRSKLYYKIKALTGETPADYFKKFKLNRAKELLTEGGRSIAEVSDLTGFSNQTVFTRNFKKQFGMTPSEFLKKGS